MGTCVYVQAIIMRQRVHIRMKKKRISSICMYAQLPWGMVGIYTDIYIYICIMQKKKNIYI